LFFFYCFGVINNEIVEDRIGVKKGGGGEYRGTATNNNKTFSPTNRNTVNNNSNIKRGNSNQLKVTSQENLIFGPDVDINQIIMNRSQYILKRKFEIYEKELKDLYEKRLDLSGQVKIEDFPQLEEDIFEILKVSFSEISKPQELIKNELLQQFNREQYYYILKDIYKYLDDNKHRYNRIVQEKRGHLLNKIMGINYYLI